VGFDGEFVVTIYVCHYTLRRPSAAIVLSLAAQYYIPLLIAPSHRAVIAPNFLANQQKQVSSKMSLSSSGNGWTADLAGLRRR
jgi:hypothetical protein